MPGQKFEKLKSVGASKKASFSAILKELAGHCEHVGEITLFLLSHIPGAVILSLKFIKACISAAGHIIAVAAVMLWHPFSALFVKIGCAIRALFKKSGAAYKSGGIKAMNKAAVKVFKEGIENNRAAATKVKNFAIPSVGILVLALTVFVFTHLTFGLVLEYDGIKLGCVERESIYYNAENQLLQRVFAEDKDEIEIVPQFKLAVVNKNSFLSSDEVTDRLIEASSSIIEEASGLYVDNTFVGAVTDKQALENTIDGILAKYKTDNPDDIIEFVKPVEIKDGLYPVSGIMEVSQLSQKILGETSAEIIYTVSKGDTPYTVARRSGISLETLYSLNPIAKSTFVIGQKIKIASSEPFLSVKVMRHETVKETVAYKTITTKNNNYYLSYKNVTKKGVNGVNEVTYLVTYLNGVATGREVEKTKVISNPVDEKITVGTKSASSTIRSTAASSTGSGRVPGFIWPTNGRISCRWWGYYNHRGIDLAAPRGTPIYAAASGTVVSYENIRSGYGRHIVISHGNGVQTLYAHTDAVYVKVGDRVSQGQLIAAVGRTGWATGYHLHFGVLINGVYKNPEIYLP